MTLTYAPEVNTDSGYAARLGFVLRTARYIREMTREQVAEKCSTTDETIARWERGEVDLRGHSLRQLAGALKVPADLLLDPPVTRSEILVRIAAYDAVRSRQAEP